MVKRTEQLGAGVRVEKTTSEAIRAALEQVLTDSKYRENAKIIGADFHNCPGAAGAADKIQQILSCT